MSEKITYYKVISGDNQSCHGGYFDWTDYLPKGDNPGIWTPEIENIEECASGYHVTKYWNMWYQDSCRVFQCEVEGLVETPNIGVVDKCVARRIRLVRELPYFSDKNNTGNCNTGDRNTGNWNTGNCNTGKYNTGNWNAGDWNTGNINTGDCNTGNRNTGNRNTGNCNTGKWNTGHCNTGKYNTGDRNTGHWNTGNCNTGDRNTGEWNTGDRNTGNRNTGEWNTGDWNTGNCNTGFFNTTTPEYITVFNKPCRMDDWRHADKPNFMFFDLNGTYKESWRKAYDCASNIDKLRLVKLPNFDADVFYEISGIHVNPENGQPEPEDKKEVN
jgi:hypothetical protein